MENTIVTRRRVLATGGAASLLLLAPDVVRAVAVQAATNPAISVGFVNTLGPLVAGMRVTPGTNVANDASLSNRILEIAVGKLHPTTDAAFPNTSLDALFTQSGKTYPYFALSHRRGEALHPSSYAAVPGSTGLRFSLKTGDVVRTGGLGSGRPNGLRTGTYLFGLGAGTWSRAATLSNNTAQRSVVLVVRPA